MTTQPISTLILPPIADPAWVITLFSFTPTLLEARQRPDEILTGILENGLARHIEIDAPQHFRSYPTFDDAELGRTRDVLERYGARLNVLGCYHDASPAAGVFLNHNQGVDLWRGRSARRAGSAPGAYAWGWGSLRRRC